MYKLRNRMCLSKTDCERKHKYLTKKQKKGQMALLTYIFSNLANIAKGLARS